MTDGAPGMRYQPSLDGLRAIAVVGVILYHLGYRWARGGFLGVDTFFVLSGYLITTLLLIEWGDRSGIALAPFWGRRLRRLLPPLLLVLLGTAIAAATFTAATELGRLRGDALSALFYVANWRFVLSGQSYFDLFSAPSPLRHLWSLAIEEQFYLVWPIVVLGALRLGRGAHKTLVGICAVGIVASVAAMAALYSPADPSRAYYGTDARAHTLLVGCLLAIALRWRSPSSARAARIVSIAGSAAFVGVVIAFVTVSDHSSGLYHGGSLAFAVLVVPVIAASSIGARGPVQFVLSTPLLRWIGRLSYGIYLWHWPMIVWMTADRTHLDGLTLDAARVAATLTLATLSFYLVERPIRRTTFASLRSRALAPVSVVVVAVALVGATAGAEAPPSFLGAGASGISLCRPRADEQRAVDAALGASTTPPPRAAHRLLLVGDSTACSMLLGLRGVGANLGVDVTDASVIGCGVASGAVSGLLVPPFNPQCADFVAQTDARALAASHPDFVVWASVWERYSLVVDQHQILVQGSAQWEQELLQRMNHALGIFAAGGAHVFLVTQPPFSSGVSLLQRNGDFGKKIVPTKADDQIFIRLNEVMRRFAQLHTHDVTLLDLSAFVCRGQSPCPPVVAGIRFRPVDGAHFGAAGSIAVARWLLANIVPK